MAIQSTQAPVGTGDLGVRYLTPFFVLTFALTWGLGAALVVFPEQITAIFGALSVTNPLYLIMTWSPGLVGLLLVVMTTGFSGLRRFIARLFDTSVPLAWWAFVLLALPALKMTGALLNGTPITGLLNLSPFMDIFSMSVFMLFLGPVEEFGWRGVALPLMQRLMAPVWAGVIVGFVWAFWHLPAFFVGGTPQSAWALLPFLIGVTAIGVVMAVVYNKTGGNLLFPILTHWQLNIAFWPEAQPWENYLSVGLALVLLWVHRDVMFARDKGLTEVVPTQHTIRTRKPA
ncbi:MAG: CPBP family intramembrane glutamic endopeptidase [Gemmobacter sp.]